jgi:Uma2 family endonuclease
MTSVTLIPSLPKVVYPDSDGRPMAENTKQLRWIVVLYCGLCAVFRNRDDVFVAADLPWYPVEGHPEITTARDTYVVFGRPKGDRGSYQQWLEGGIAPQVVFKILWPNNDTWEMSDKLAFFDDRGVEEYYLYDPEKDRLAIYVRQGTALGAVAPLAVRGHCRSDPFPTAV